MPIIMIRRVTGAGRGGGGELDNHQGEVTTWPALLTRSVPLLCLATFHMYASKSSVLTRLSINFDRVSFKFSTILFGITVSSYAKTTHTTGVYSGLPNLHWIC